MTHPPRSRDVPPENPPSSPLALVVAWLMVGVPLAWGVEQTIIKSLALFH